MSCSGSTTDLTLSVEEVPRFERSDFDGQRMAQEKVRRTRTVHVMNVGGSFEENQGSPYEASISSGQIPRLKVRRAWLGCPENRR